MTMIRRRNRSKSRKSEPMVQRNFEPYTPIDTRLVYKKCRRCGGCRMAGHGFICKFRDGSCLKYPRPEGVKADAVCI